MAESVFGFESERIQRTKDLGESTVIVPAPTADIAVPTVPRTSHSERFPSSPLPLTPLERFLLQCDTPRSPMVIRVVLRLSGECDLNLYTQTLQQAIRRHPLLSCRLDKGKREFSWVSGEPEPIATSRRAGSVYEPECGPLNNAIDLTQSAGLRISIIVMDDGVKVIMDVHHAVTDGNGMRQVVTDWFHLYDCAVTGTPTRLPSIDPDRLLQRHRFPQPASIAPISLKDAVRNFLVTIRGRTSRWIRKGREHRKISEQASSHSVEVIFSNEQNDLVHQRIDAWKVKLNDLVMACCMSTFAALAPSGAMGHRVTVLNPMDLRLPSDRTLSAANRFGFAFLRRPRSECSYPAQLLRGIHDEMTYVRSNYIGVEFIKGLATAARIPGGIDFFRRLGLFIPSLQWTCLGDISRGGRRLVPWKDGMPVSGSLRLETATGFAPYADNVPLSVATCEANRRMTLTVRSSPGFLTMEETRTFASVLVNLLCTIELPSEPVVSADRGETGEC